MRRKKYHLLCIALLAGLTAACGSRFKAEEDTVFISKDGDVISASIEDFNEEYYNEEELEKFINESIEDYVESNGDGTLTLDQFEVSEKEEEKTAKLYLKYANYIDYAQFNGVEFFSGTVEEAEAAGYATEQDFCSVEDGTASETTQMAETVLANKENRVAILGENTALKVDGTILYVSSGNVEVTGKNSARITFDMEAADAQPAWVVYE